MEIDSTTGEMSHKNIVKNMKSWKATIFSLLHFYGCTKVLLRYVALLFILSLIKLGVIFKLIGIYCILDKIWAYRL